MNRYIYKIILSFLFISLSLASYAQQYGFKNYSLEEGLPQSEVLSLIQDKKGNLWLGTNGGGVSRFNGREFFSYNRKHGLADNNIRALYQDKNENLWIGTSKGISFFNGVDFLNYSEKDSLPTAIYLQIQEAGDGKIWALGINNNQRKLVYHENGRFFNVGKLYPELFDDNQVFSIISDPSGKILITTQNALYEFNDNKLTKSILNSNPLFKDEIIVPSLFDSRQQCWYRTFKLGFGITLFKTSDGKISGVVKFCIRLCSFLSKRIS